MIIDIKIPIILHFIKWGHGPSWGRGQKDESGPWPRWGRGQKNKSGPWPRWGRGQNLKLGPWPHRGRPRAPEDTDNIHIKIIFGNFGKISKIIFKKKY